MLTYTYRTVYLCQHCALAVIAHAPGDRRKPRPVCLLPMDCPQHCDRCGVHLENPLTDVGREFVRQWCEVDPALITHDSVRLAVAIWRRFYFSS